MLHANDELVVGRLRGGWPHWAFLLCRPKGPTTSERVASLLFDSLFSRQPPLPIRAQIVRAMHCWEFRRCRATARSCRAQNTDPVSVPPNSTGIQPLRNTTNPAKPKMATVSTFVSENQRVMKTIPQARTWQRAESSRGGELRPRGF